MQENNKAYYKKDLQEIFKQIRAKFRGNSVSQTESEEEKAIKEMLRQNDPENAMHIADEYGDWYQRNRINPLKDKMRGAYNNIVQGRNDGQRWVFQHAREKIVDRLDELLPEKNVRELNLIGTSANNIEARIRLSTQLSQEIQNSAGEERDLKIQAFELVKGLQAFHETGYRDGETIGYDNPLKGNYPNNRTYQEWVCYLYLANVFSPLEDILMPRNDLSEKDYRDQVFQSFIRVLNDIIRGHNTDPNKYPNQPFHPNNAPSCVPGSKGRAMLNGGMYIKGLTFIDFEPVYNDPTSSVDSTIVTYVLNNLDTQRSKDLLKAIDDLTMDPQGFELKPFFNLTHAQKDEIAEGLAMDVMNDWTLDLSPSDKRKVIKEHKDQIKAAFIYKIDLALAKYLPEFLDVNEVKGNFYDRLTEGAFKKIFDSPQPASQTFKEFQDISSIMRIYYQQKGIESAIAVLRELSNDPEVNRPLYLTFFKHLIIASGTESITRLNQTEKETLRNLLSNPNGQVETSVRDALFDKFNWEEMSTSVLPQILGNNWKGILFEENNPLLDTLLSKYLSAKKYTDFCKMTSDLYTNNNNNDLTDVAYRNKAEVALKEALIKDFANPRPYLLYFLFGTQEPDFIVKRAIDKIIPELLEELRNSDVEQKQKDYVKLLTRILMAGGAPHVRENGGSILNDDDKALLSRILLNPQGAGEESYREEILKEISWKDLSTALPSILGVDWKNRFIQSDALNMFVENVLKARRHNEFNEMTEVLTTNNPNLDTKREFTNKCVEKIPVVLEHELLSEPAKFDLLNFLSDPNTMYSFRLTITGFLKGLEPAKVAKLLKNLESSPANLQKIRERIKDNFSPEEIDNLFNYFATEPKIGSPCVDFLTYLESRLARDGYDPLRNKITYCLNRMYNRAIEDKDWTTLKALVKVPEKQTAMALLLNQKFGAFLNFNHDENLTDEQKIAKAQAKEELVNWVSVMESLNDRSLGTYANSIQASYNRAFERKNWEACRLLLPIMKRNPERYTLYPGDIMHSSSRSPESKRELYNIAQEILGTEENKSLFVKLLKKPDNHGTFVNHEGKYTDERLEGLSHLVVTPLNTIKYEGNNPEIQALQNSVRNDLEAFIDDQLTLLLNKSVSQEQIVISEITSSLIKEFGKLFRDFPQNPNEAEKRYEAILKETQMKINFELKDTASKKQFEKLFNQLSVARDSFVNAQPVNEHYVPFSWSAKNSKGLFQQVTTALEEISNTEGVDENIKNYIKTLLNETKKRLGNKLSEKEAQILYDSLSASYNCIKRVEGYEDSYTHAMKEITQNMESFPWMKVVGYILIGLLALALLTAAALVLVALATPAAPLSMTILGVVGSIFTQLSAFFTSVMASVSSFASTIFAAGTAATASTITAGAVSIEAAAGITAGTTGVAGILTGGAGFFGARRDVKDAQSMEKVKELTQNIHEETVAPRNGAN